MKDLLEIDGENKDG
jgi:hypothetical protein